MTSNIEGADGRIIRPGDDVEVRAVWAANGNGLPPSYAWLSGYTFVREDINGVQHAMVRIESGTFAGSEIRVNPRDVRRAA